MIPEPAMFAALGHQTRLEILGLLSEFSPANLSYLALRLKASDAHVSHHIGILQRAGLVSKKKVGSWASFSLNSERFKEMILFLGRMLEKPNETQPNDGESPTA